MNKEKFLKKKAEIETKNSIYLVCNKWVTHIEYNHQTDISIEDFIVLFLNTLWCKYNTYSIDKLNRKHFQCDSRAARSAEDIYRLCKYYFPRKNITLNKVMRLLFSLVQQERIRTSKCYDIHKRIFKSARYASYNYCIDNIDEFGLKFNDWEKL